MVSLMYILFICIVTPLALMLFLLDKNARVTVTFVIVGMFMCMFVSEINSIFLGLFRNDVYYVTTTVTPVTEEIVKALPVVFFGFVVSDDRERLLSISMAVGIGFAVLENTYILVSAAGTVSIFWALVRGFGAGLMHGVCTSAVGLGVSFVRKRRKLFYIGTYALLIVAVIYHAVYNMLVQSAYPYVGFVLPLLTYMPLVALAVRTKKLQPAAKGSHRIS